MSEQILPLTVFSLFGKVLIQIFIDYQNKVSSGFVYYFFFYSYKFILPFKLLEDHKLLRIIGNVLIILFYIGFAYVCLESYFPMSGQWSDNETDS